MTNAIEQVRRAKGVHAAVDAAERAAGASVRI